MEYNNPFLVGKLKEVTGSATVPASSDNRAVVVLVSADGEFEALPGNDAVAKKWPRVKEEYRRWWRGQVGFKLGATLSIQIDSYTEVVLGVVKKDKASDIDAKAANQVLDAVGQNVKLSKASVHVNNPGVDLKPAVTEYFLKRCCNVWIYS